MEVLVDEMKNISYHHFIIGSMFLMELEKQN